MTSISDAQTPRGRLDRGSALKFGCITVLALFLIYFYLLAPPNAPLAVFLPYQAAVAAAAGLIASGWIRKEWSMVVLGGVALLFLFLVGGLYFPLTVADCQDWVENGRLRNGSF